MAFPCFTTAIIKDPYTYFIAAGFIIAVTNAIGARIVLGVGDTGVAAIPK
jgi:hypothetical protein